jgi:hypothetical protein
MPTPVRDILFNPLLSTVDEVRTFLRDRAKGTAHVFQRVLHVWDGKDYSTIDLSDKSDAYFLDDTRLNELGGVLGERMAAHEGALAKVMDYEVVTPTELTFDLPLRPGELLCFALSLQGHPNYFDLISCNTYGDTICYNARGNPSITGLRHSGDLLGRGAVLLHTVTAGADLTTDPVAVGVSGYSGHMLHRYKQQNPTVLLIDHAAKTQYMVPVPLSEAAIGKATLCFPVVLERAGNVVRVTILNNPPTQEKIYASSESLPAARPTIRAALHAAADLVGSLPSAMTAPAASDDTSAASAATPAPATSVTVRPDRACVVIAEEGTAPPASETATLVWFGCGISATRVPAMAAASGATVLPCCAGNVLQGGKVLALGRPFTGDLTVYEGAMGGVRVGSVPIVVVSDRMTDQARLLNPYARLNGLFILQPRATYQLSILDQPPARNAYLTDLNINAVTALAGPQSVVVVQLGGNYFFYRGVCWPGVLPVVPGFGADVTDEMTALLSNISVLRDATFVWPSVVDLSRDGGNVYLGTQVVEVSQIGEIFEGMDLQTVLHLRPRIQDVLTQLQCVLNSDNINKVSAELIALLKRKITDVVDGYKRPYVDLVLKCVAGGPAGAETGAAEKRKGELHAAYRGAEREAKEAVQWLIDALGQMVSSRMSSTKGYDLNQIAKKAATASNVADARNMGAEDVANILSAQCGNVGVVLGNVDAGTLRLALEAVAGDRFLTARNAPPLSGRQLLTAAAVRSSAEVSTLLPVMKDIHRGPLSGKKGGAFTWALPQLAPLSDVTQSSVPWPCFDRHVNLSDPSKVYWIDEALLPDIAKLRILSRGTFSNAGNDMGLTKISPSSRNLGFFLIVSLLDLMDSLAESMAPGAKRIDCALGAEETADFHGPLAQTFRGLFGQLFTLMASGTGKPLCTAFQLVMTNPKMEVPDHAEIGIFSSVASLLPHTRWPLHALQRNAKLLLVRALRQNVVDPVTAPIRKAVASMKQAKDRQHLDRKNRELAFLQVANEVIRHLSGAETSAAPAEDEVRAMASRLLTRLPPDGRNDGGLGIVDAYLRELAERGRVTKARQDQVAQTCLDIFMKRSAHFKKAKAVTLKALRAGKDAQVEKVVGQMEEEKESLVAKWGAGDGKVQNWEAYQAAVAGGGQDKVAGDAELGRIPWRVLTGEEAPKGSVSQAVRDILGRDPGGDAGAGQLVSAGGARGPTLQSRSLEDQLRGLQNGGKAAELYVSMRKWNLESFCTAMALPVRSTRTFLACVGLLGDEESRDFLFRTCETLLEGWQSPNDAELHALNAAS